MDMSPGVSVQFLCAACAVMIAIFFVIMQEQRRRRCQAIDRDAMALMAAGRYAQAEREFKHLLQVVDHLRILRGDLRARTLFNLAVATHRQGHKEEALKAAVLTFGSLRQFQDPAHVRAAIDWLAELLVEVGAHRRAVALLEISVDEWAKATGRESVEVGRRLFALGRAQTALGMREASLVNLDRAAGIYRSSSEADPIDLARVLETLGDTYCGLNHLSEAELAYQEAMRITRSGSGPVTSIAAILDKLAQLHSGAGRLVIAGEILEEALELRESEPSIPATEVAASLTRLSQNSRCLGNLAAAEGWARRAIEVLERANDASLAEAFQLLADIWREQDLVTEAAPLYRQARRVLENQDTPDLQRLAEALENEAGILRALLKTEEAEALEVRAAELRGSARPQADSSSADPMDARTFARILDQVRRAG